MIQQWVIVEGLPLCEVGARLSRSRSAGYAWLRRYGITRTGPIVSQDHLVTRWRAGVPAADLAAETGLSRDAVCERLITASVLTPRRDYYVLGSSADPLAESSLREWHLEERLTADEIADRTGTTARQVRYRLTRYNLSRRRPGPMPRPANVPDGLADLYLLQQLTCAQIGAMLNMSSESVRKHLAGMGVPRRRGPARRHPDEQG